MVLDTPVREVTAEVYEIPTDQPEGDGTLAWSSTAMVVVTGRGGRGPRASGGPTPGREVKTVVAEEFAGDRRGAEAWTIPGPTRRCSGRVGISGSAGVVACAISAVDIALWDLKARLLELTARRAARSGPHPRSRSTGAGDSPPTTTARPVAQLEHWVERVAYPAGEDQDRRVVGTGPERDLHRVALTRRVVGDERRGVRRRQRGLPPKAGGPARSAISSDHDVSWFEEPVCSDDLAGLREVRDQCAPTWRRGSTATRLPYFAQMIVAGAVDCVQVDVTRCGGYTDWLAVADLAAAHGLEVSGHCAPNLHAQVAVARTQPPPRGVLPRSSPDRVHAPRGRALPERGRALPGPWRARPRASLRADRRRAVEDGLAPLVAPPQFPASTSFDPEEARSEPTAARPRRSRNVRPEDRSGHRGVCRSRSGHRPDVRRTRFRRGAHRPGPAGLEGAAATTCRRPGWPGAHDPTDVARFDEVDAAASGWKRSSGRSTCG